MRYVILSRSKKNKLLRRLLLLLIAVYIFTPACSTVNKVLVKQDKVLAKQDRVPVEQLSAESELALAGGDYQKAMDVYKDPLAKNQKNEELIQSYIKTVELIKREADEALKQKKINQAINIYNILINNFADFSLFAGNLSFSAADLESGIKNSRMAGWEIEVKQKLKSGKYEEAFRIFHHAEKEYPGEKTLRNIFAAAVKEVKAAADQAYAAGDFALAGKLNGLLLKNMTLAKTYRIKTDFSQDDLVNTLKICSRSLTNLGLAEYRNGNLTGAIAFWESILVFEPENAEAKKAVQTARTQLKK